jgi:hypothetical protein
MYPRFGNEKTGSPQTPTGTDRRSLNKWLLSPAKGPEGHLLDCQEGVDVTESSLLKSQGAEWGTSTSIYTCSDKTTHSSSFAKAVSEKVI